MALAAGRLAQKSCRAGLGRAGAMRAGFAPKPALLETHASSSNDVSFDVGGVTAAATNNLVRGGFYIYDRPHEADTAPTYTTVLE